MISEKFIGAKVLIFFRFMKLLTHFLRFATQIHCFVYNFTLDSTYLYLRNFHFAYSLHYFRVEYAYLAKICH